MCIVLQDEVAAKQAEVVAAKERTKKLDTFLEIKESERDWQMAKEEVAMVSMEGYQNDARIHWLKHLDARSAVQQHHRTVSEKRRRSATMVNLRGCLQDAKAFGIAAMLYAEELKKISALTPPIDPGEAKKFAADRDVLERLVWAFKERNIEFSRQFLGGVNDDSRRARDPSLVSDPGKAFGKGSLGVGRTAGVFEKGGFAFIRRQATNRPSEMRGWAAPVPNEAGSKYTGLCNQPLGDGRHTWDFHLDEIDGKGVICLGVVRVRDAFFPATIEATRIVGQTVLETSRLCTKWDIGGCESDAIDLDG